MNLCAVHSQWYIKECSNCQSVGHNMNYYPPEQVIADMLLQIEARATRAERERIFAVLKQLEKTTFPGDVWHYNPFTYAMELIEAAKSSAVE